MHFKKLFFSILPAEYVSFTDTTVEQVEIEGRINKSYGDEGVMPSKTQKKLSIEELKLIVGPIATEYGVEKVYLFGSMARGDDDDDSDYDFCIERGKISDLFELSGFFGDLKDAIGHEIDLVTTGALPPEFMENVIRDGVVLYG